MNKIAYVFKLKTLENKEKLDYQDRVHIRLKCYAEIIARGDLEKLSKAKFIEKFTYDKKSSTATFKIYVLDERRLENADA